MTAHDPTDPDFLTAPERFCERDAGKKVLEKVKKCGGCFCCKNRNKHTESIGLGLAECGLKPPAQFKKIRCDFKPEYSRLYPGKHENHLDRD